LQTLSSSEIRRALRYLFDKPQRVRALYEAAHAMDPRHYWQTLAEVYQGSESLYAEAELLGYMMEGHGAKTYSRPHDTRLRPMMMNRDERRALARMKDEVSVYRGASDTNAEGMSWTTRPKVARFFATRAPFQCVPFMLVGKVAKYDIRAYLAGRGEAEVVVPYDKVRITRKVKLKEHIPSSSLRLFHAVQSGQLQRHDDFKVRGWLLAKSGMSLETIEREMDQNIRKAEALWPAHAELMRRQLEQMREGYTTPPPGEEP
jgi:hypothetical protein